MQERYGKDGLVVLSVSTDLITARERDPDVPAEKVVGKVKKFLTDMKAPFGALIVDEENTFLQEKLHFVAAPCAFVFNRKGQWTQFSGDKNEFKHDKIEALVKQLVAEK